MILSMTGFGRGTAVLNGREITVELRSVNSRYFEYSSRIPRSCSYMDSRLKKQLNERVTRGKVELSMTIQNVEAADAEVTVNMELARSYQKALRNLSEKLCIKNDVTVSTLTRFPDVLATRHADVDEEQLWADVSAVTAQALDNFIAMRAAEGAKMKADVESRLCFLEERVGRVETLSAESGDGGVQSLPVRGRADDSGGRQDGGGEPDERGELPDSAADGLGRRGCSDGCGDGGLPVRTEYGARERADAHAGGGAGAFGGVQGGAWGGVKGNAEFGMRNYVCALGHEKCPAGGGAQSGEGLAL